MLVCFLGLASTLFFDAAVLFLDPISDDLRPGKLLCFTALVQLLQRLFVQPDTEYEILGILRYRTASACDQSVHRLSWSHNNYILIPQKVKRFLKKFTAAAQEGSGGYH